MPQLQDRGLWHTESVAWEQGTEIRAGLKKSGWAQGVFVKHFERWQMSWALQPSTHPCDLPQGCHLPHHSLQLHVSARNGHLEAHILWGPCNWRSHCWVAAAHLSCSAVANVLCFLSLLPLHCFFFLSFSFLILFLYFFVSFLPTFLFFFFCVHLPCSYKFCIFPSLIVFV